jgi:guanylate kinase
MKQAEAPHRRLVILAGPSGAGKTTVRDRLIEGERGTDFTFSVSMTTRPRRPGEREGEDYRFVDRATFEALVASGGMLEHAVVHGDLYGTPADNLDRARAAGRHLLLDIDVQGARQVRGRTDDVVSIFLLPPSEEEMVRRLRGRGSESDGQLRRRFESALAELEALPEFDYAVVNDDLDETVRDVVSILRTEDHSLATGGAAALALAARLKGEIERQMT